MHFSTKCLYLIFVDISYYSKFNDACFLWEDILLEHPTDLLSIKMLHDIYLVNGNSYGLRDSIARVAPYWTADMPLYG